MEIRGVWIKILILILDIAGNAYMSNFFTNMKNISELNNALKSYNQAKLYLKSPNSDLHYNMASLYNFL